MLEKEILRGNEAIALFLNWRKGKDNDPRWGEEWFNVDGVRMGKVLNFSTDWNVLMPVIAKIFSLPFAETEGLEEYIDIYMNADEMGFNTPVEVCFDKVVSFIEWYETNKTERNE